MPSLEESFPTLVGLEPDPAEPAGASITRGEAFEGMIRVAISRSGENVRNTGVLEALDHAGLLVPGWLAAAGPIEVLDSLSESGSRLPSKSALLLTRLAKWFNCRFPYGDEFDEIDAIPTSTLRDELSSLNGVGQATADAILLHGLG